MRLHPFSLISELRQAATYLEAEFLGRLRASGWPMLSANQVFTLAHLDEGGTSPAELARRMAMSRQSMQKNLERLAAVGLIEIVPHPKDQRSRLVTLSDAGTAFTDDAARLIDGFERRLEASMGSDAVHAARRVLTADWQQVLATVQKASGR